MGNGIIKFKNTVCKNCSGFEDGECGSHLDEIPTTRIQACINAEKLFFEKEKWDSMKWLFMDFVGFPICFEGKSPVKIDIKR